MKILLDECPPKRLAGLLIGHDVVTVIQMKWKGLSNGSLLAAADRRVDAFLTVDKNLIQQQTVTKFRIAIVVLRAPSNRIEDLKPLIPEVLKVLLHAKPGNVYAVST